MELNNDVRYFIPVKKNSPKVRKGSFVLGQFAAVVSGLSLGLISVTAQPVVPDAEATSA